jgi:hypothetical protein
VDVGSGKDSRSRFECCDQYFCEPPLRLPDNIMLEKTGT